MAEADQDLADEIQAVVKDHSKSFDLVFSRNKMLRRKIKRKKMLVLNTLSEAESESTVTAEECVRIADSGLSEYSESNESAISESEPTRFHVLTSELNQSSESESTQSAESELTESVESELTDSVNSESESTLSARSTESTETAESDFSNDADRQCGRN